MRVVGWCLRIGAAVWLAACATTAERRSAGGGDRTVLTAEDLRTETARTLDDVIRRQRPQWLTKRGPVSLQAERGGDIVVYRDGVRAGGPEVLPGIPTDLVESVRFLSAAEATTRFGTGHAHGAILVVTRRR